MTVFELITEKVGLAIYNYIVPGFIILVALIAVVLILGGIFYGIRKVIKGAKC